MFSIYVDDERIPVNKFDAICKTPDEAIKIFRKKYKEGNRHFFLEMDYDSGIPDVPFIKILKEIETYVNLGKMKNLNIDIHIHTGNSVGRENIRNIIRHNDYMYEIF